MEKPSLADYLKNFFDDFLLIVEACLEVLDIEFEEVEGRRTGLTEHVGEAYVLTDHRVQIHPQ